MYIYIYVHLKNSGHSMGISPRFFKGEHHIFPLLRLCCPGPSLVGHVSTA